MNHPITMKTLTDLRQTELLREAAALRMAKTAHAGHAGIEGRWLRLAGMMCLIAVTLIWLFA
jgi:hypothetical protein